MQEIGARQPRIDLFAVAALLTALLLARSLSNLTHLPMFFCLAAMCVANQKFFYKSFFAFSGDMTHFSLWRRSLLLPNLIKNETQ